MILCKHDYQERQNNTSSASITMSVNSSNYVNKAKVRSATSEICLQTITTRKYDNGRHIEDVTTVTFTARLV